MRQGQHQSINSWQALTIDVVNKEWSILKLFDSNVFFNNLLAANHLITLIKYSYKTAFSTVNHLITLIKYSYKTALSTKQYQTSAEIPQSLYQKLIKQKWY